MIQSREYGPKVEYGSVEATRDPTKGIIIRAQSRDIKAFFERITKLAIEGLGKKGENAPDPTADMIKSTKKWGAAIRYYNLPVAAMPQLADATFNAIGEGLFVGEFVNLSFLRAVDLDQGIEIIFPGLIAEPVVEGFLKGCADRIDTFYGHYIKPSYQKLVLSSEIVTRY